MQRVVLGLIVSLALVFSASLGAGVASADRCGRLEWSCEQKKAERFIKPLAKAVAADQPALFPNARISARKVHSGCIPLDPWKLFIRNWGWRCSGFISVHERSTIKPPEEYDPEWPIQQRTVRSCRWGFAGAKRLIVRPKRGSRKLRLLGGWRMDCALEESAIRLWNNYGPDYQPGRSEPVPYEVIKPPAKDPASPRGDLLPPPSGEPGGPPPGPISSYGGAGSSSTARSATHIFKGCGYWQHHWADARYRVYPCYWGVDVPPFGAGLGIFDQSSTYYEWYYWAGNDNAGRPISRFFLSGNL